MEFKQHKRTSSGGLGWPVRGPDAGGHGQGTQMGHCGRVPVDRLLHVSRNSGEVYDYVKHYILSYRNVFYIFHTAKFLNL